MRAFHRRLIEEQEDAQRHENDNKAVVSVAERVARARNQQNESPSFAVMYSTLHKAASDGSILGVEHLLQSRDVNVDDFDHTGMCPIHYASERGHAEVVQLLLSKQCGADVRSLDRLTALMLASKNGHTKVIELLHSHGADLMAKNRGGLTAAHFAAQGDHALSIETLARLFTTDLDYFAHRDQRYNGHKDSGKSKNLKEGVETSNKGSSYLKACFSRGLYHGVPIDELVCMPTNAVIDLPTNGGMRPIHFAALTDSRTAAESLVALGVDPNVVDSIGDSPLHKAGRSCHFLLYRQLVTHGASEIVRNAMMESPSDLINDRDVPN